MRIVVDIHNSIFRDAVARTLRAFSSEFEVYDSEDPAQTADVCMCVDADTVLMEVTGRSKWGLDERLLIWDKIKNEKENCKVVLLVDENSEQELADEVRQVKKEGRIDQFIYGSVSAAYLPAVVDAL